MEIAISINDAADADFPPFIVAVLVQQFIITHCLSVDAFCGLHDLDGFVTMHDIDSSSQTECFQFHDPLCRHVSLQQYSHEFRQCLNHPLAPRLPLLGC